MDPKSEVVKVDTSGIWIDDEKNGDTCLTLTKNSGNPEVVALLAAKRLSSVYIDCEGRRCSHGSPHSGQTLANGIASYRSGS